MIKVFSDSGGNHKIILPYRMWLIILYALKLHDVICQLYLNSKLEKDNKITSFKKLVQGGLEVMLSDNIHHPTPKCPTPTPDLFPQRKEALVQTSLEYHLLEGRPSPGCGCH